jgi:hypothetical protein
MSLARRQKIGPAVTSGHSYDAKGARLRMHLLRYGCAAESGEHQSWLGRFGVPAGFQIPSGRPERRR